MLYLTVRPITFSYAQKLKDLAKENPKTTGEKDGKKSKSHKKRLFASSCLQQIQILNCFSDGTVPGMAWYSQLVTLSLKMIKNS